MADTGGDRKSGPIATWHPDPDRAQVWPDLEVGSRLTILKINHDGAIAFEYPGTIVDTDAPAPWIAVACEWTLPTVEADGLVFVTGDTLIEFYSPEHCYNAFRVHAADGTIRGWYANVTYPTVVHGTTLEWHDLWLDLIVLPDGSMTVRDQDELEESGIEGEEPELHARIVATREKLVGLARERAFPFNEP